MLLSINISFESCVIRIRLAIKVKSNSPSFKIMIYLLRAIRDMLIVIANETKKHCNMLEFIILDVIFESIMTGRQMPFLLSEKKRYKCTS